MSKHTGDEHKATSMHPLKGKLQIQLSLLTDYYLLGETSYDDLYMEEGWKTRVFKRYREATGLSPLNCLKHYNQLLELQNIQLTGLDCLQVKKQLEACAIAMKRQMTASMGGKDQLPGKRGQLLKMCSETLSWLEDPANALADKNQYLKRQQELEEAFSDAFKKRFSIAG